MELIVTPDNIEAFQLGFSAVMHYYFYGFIFYVVILLRKF